MITNAVLMCIPLWGYFKLKSKSNQFYSSVAFIVYWMFFEWIHLNWQLSWPWLPLGNIFATHPNWVQWYAIIGVSGGTLWVLIVNMLLFRLSQQYLEFKKIPLQKLLPVFIVIFLPILISYFSIPTITNNNNSSNVVIVQRNIDPYQ
jgi:apolipoprotein N-acyltransferase